MGMAFESPKTLPHKCKVNTSYIILPVSELFSISIVSVRRLCNADKQRVRQIILELALADQKKVCAEKKLYKERCRFRRAFVLLNQQMVLLEREKSDILPVVYNY